LCNYCFSIHIRSTVHIYQWFIRHIVLGCVQLCIIYQSKNGLSLLSLCHVPRKHLNIEHSTDHLINPIDILLDQQIKPWLLLVVYSNDFLHESSDQKELA